MTIQIDGQVLIIVNEKTFIERVDVESILNNKPIYFRR